MRLPPPTQRRTVSIRPPAAPLTLPNNDPKPYRVIPDSPQPGPSGLNLNLSSSSKNSKISKTSNSTKSKPDSNGPTPAKVPKTEDKPSDKKTSSKEGSPGPVLAPQDGNFSLFYFIVELQKSFQILTLHQQTPITLFRWTMGYPK